MTELTLHPLPVAHGWGRGWTAQSVACEACGHAWIGVAPVGARGKECPQCGYSHPGYVWTGDSHELPNDGAWLTGTYG